jgi:chromosome segregation ATPase
MMTDEENRSPQGTVAEDRTMKRHRSSSAMGRDSPHRDCNGAIPRSDASAILSLQSTLRLTIEQKDSEIARLQECLGQAQAAIIHIQTEKSALDEENKILKRAVTIQDTRQRELQAQNQGLQEVLAQAASHVANLERANAQLRMDLLMKEDKSFSSDIDFDRRPPDVY